MSDVQAMASIHLRHIQDARVRKQTLAIVMAILAQPLGVPRLTAEPLTLDHIETTARDIVRRAEA